MKVVEGFFTGLWNWFRIGFGYVPQMSQTGIASVPTMAFACFEYVLWCAAALLSVATIVLIRRHRFLNPAIPGNQIRNQSDQTDS